MKANRLIVVLILFIAGCFSMELSAQEAIRALVKKCENMDNVDVSIAKSKDEETKKVSKVITNISFSDNETLVKEILAAFNKDKDMADKEIENRSNGKINNLYYRFGSVTYSFSMDGNSGSLSVIDKSME